MYISHISLSLFLSLFIFSSFLLLSYFSFCVFLILGLSVCVPVCLSFSLNLCVCNAVHFTRTFSFSLSSLIYIDIHISARELSPSLLVYLSASVSLSVCASVCLSLFLSRCRSLYLLLHLCVYRSLCVSVVCLYVHISSSLSAVTVLIASQLNKICFAFFHWQMCDVSLPFPV